MRALEHVFCRERIQHPADTVDYLFPKELARALGVTVVTTYKLMRESLPVTTLYRRDVPVKAVERQALGAWLTDSFNWPRIDLEKITDPYFRQLIDNACQHCKPSWVPIRMAARMFGLTRPALKWHVIKNRISTTRARGILWLWRADVEKCYWPLPPETWYSEFHAF
jgi:hypothetical protein